MKMRIHQQARLANAGRHVELAPNAVLTAGEASMRPGMVTVKTFSQGKNAFQISFESASWFGVLALQFVAHQILGEDGLFAVRLVLRRPRLIIKADRQTLGRYYLGQFSNFL